MTEQIATIIEQEQKLTSREQLEHAYRELQEIVGDEQRAQQFFAHAMEIVTARTLNNDGKYTPIVDAAFAAAASVGQEEDLDHRVAGRLITLIDSKVMYDSSDEN